MAEELPDPEFWEHIERQTEHYQRLRKEYGLDKPLRIPGYGYDFTEVERQIEVLLKLEREQTWGRERREILRFVNYCAAVFLGCYMVGKKPPSPRLVYLIGRQLKVAEFSHGRAKEPIKLLDAQEFASKHPDARQIDIAREVGVTRGTVSKWVRDKKLRLGGA